MLKTLPFSRRAMLQSCGVGFGAIAFDWMNLASRAAASPVHHPATAKSVIWLFMEGGPSHIDLV
ncbi:MAG: DUF1501 domain-containing protein, partial [Planctomycetota bacterium]